ncbi:MAG: N(4)-(beta-N-acetylglucosaminyl)-L-asparaginase [Chloroflexi bacterium]|nr:N(4)-(beta-N-acetylglucosaminyl)-L-asparaginase [Chloroflexota bacterium]
MRQAKAALEGGGSAMDAVEAGTRLVEANPAEHSVGYNGYPNILGELELDASIMDGRTLNSGAVALLRGYPYAISVARQILERKLPHVLLAGEGAERFARETGAEKRGEMLSDDIRQMWQARLATVGAAQWAASQPADAPLLDLVKLATDPQRVAGTVNFLAIDSAGNICSGVSTSGWAWKYPGRIGDSPIIGAGNYADNRYGACCCMGMGEMAIRAGTARSVVLYMRMGMSLDEAAHTAMRDLHDLGGEYIGHMSLLALDRHGEHIGLASEAGRKYIYQTGDMPQYAEVERGLVDLPRRWAGEPRG